LTFFKTLFLILSKHCKVMQKQYLNNNLAVGEHLVFFHFCCKCEILKLVEGGVQLKTYKTLGIKNVNNINLHKM